MQRVLRCKDGMLLLARDSEIFQSTAHQYGSEPPHPNNPLESWALDQPDLRIQLQVCLPPWYPYLHDYTQKKMLGICSRCVKDQGLPGAEAQGEMPVPASPWSAV